MKKTLLALLLVSSYCYVYSQTFSDNFNRANSTTVGNGWIELETGTTGAQISSNRLQLGSTSPGREFVSQDVSALYKTNGISSNTGMIVWSFNFKNTRTDPSGFDNSNYGVAFILGKTTNTVNDGSGYAIIIGQSGATDAIRLARFVNGPDANTNFTDIISGNDYANQFISVKVVYNPITDEWSLFAESNATDFPRTDPSLTSTQIGATTVNTAHTGLGTDLRYVGPFWNHGTAGADNAIFDDVSVGILPITYYPKTSATNLSQPSQWTSEVTGVGGFSPSDFQSPLQLFNLNDNVVNPTVTGSTWIISGGSNLTLNNINPLVMAPTASLAVSTGSTIDLNGKPVVLKSDATNTASIGTITGSLLNATNVTVERYISSQNNRAYRLLAPSVNTTSSIYANWQENGASTLGYGTHITGSTSGFNGFDATQTGQGSMFTYDQATPAWQSVANTIATNLNAKTGYLLYIRGDRTIDLASASSPLPSNNTVLKATGSLLTGTQTFTGLTGDNGFSLITNPYASPINWSNVYGASTSLTQFYTLWDPNIGSQGGYVTVNTAGIKSNASSNATQNIQSGQAFFVQASGAAAPVVNVQEAHKSSGSNVDVFRSGTQTEIFTSSLFYKDIFGNRINADGVASVYNNEYAEVVDGNDATQIANWDEDVAIGREGKDLSIESRPLIDNADIIYLKTSRLKVQNYEWEFHASNFNNPNLQASLVDNFLNTRTAISLSGPTVIAFSVTSNSASSAADRFEVVFGPNSALPVNMNSIKAYQKANDIQVEWTAYAEGNTDRYEVEKSIDGQVFTKAGAMAARGSNTSIVYTWLDKNAGNGNHFYRIKSISKTGKADYSKIVRVQIGKTNEIAVSPNPAVDHSLSLSFNLPKGKYILALTNMIGQEVYRKALEHSGGAATQTIVLDSRFTKGVYQLSVSGNGMSYSQQVLKN